MPCIGSIVMRRGVREHFAPGLPLLPATGRYWPLLRLPYRRAVVMLRGYLCPPPARPTAPRHGTASNRVQHVGDGEPHSAPRHRRREKRSQKGLDKLEQEKQRDVHTERTLTSAWCVPAISLMTSSLPCLAAQCSAVCRKQKQTKQLSAFALLRMYPREITLNL